MPKGAWLIDTNTNTYTATTKLPLLLQFSMIVLLASVNKYWCQEIRHIIYSREKKKWVGRGGPHLQLRSYIPVKVVPLLLSILSYLLKWIMMAYIITAMFPWFMITITSISTIISSQNKPHCTIIVDCWIDILLTHIWWSWLRHSLAFSPHTKGVICNSKCPRKLGW